MFGFSQPPVAEAPTEFMPLTVGQIKELDENKLKCGVYVTESSPYVKYRKRIYYCGRRDCEGCRGRLVRKELGNLGQAETLYGITLSDDQVMAFVKRLSRNDNRYRRFPLAGDQSLFFMEKPEEGSQLAFPTSDYLNEVIEAMPKGRRISGKLVTKDQSPQPLAGSFPIPVSSYVTKDISDLDMLLAHEEALDVIAQEPIPTTEKEVLAQVQRFNGLFRAGVAKRGGRIVKTTNRFHRVHLEHIQEQLSICSKWTKAVKEGLMRS